MHPPPPQSSYLYNMDSERWSVNKNTKAACFVYWPEVRMGVGGLLQGTPSCEQQLDTKRGVFCVLSPNKLTVQPPSVAAHTTTYFSAPPDVDSAVQVIPRFMTTKAASLPFYVGGLHQGSHAEWKNSTQPGGACMSLDNLHAVQGWFHLEKFLQTMLQASLRQTNPIAFKEKEHSVKMMQAFKSHEHFFPDLMHEEIDTIFLGWDQSYPSSSRRLFDRLIVGDDNSISLLEQARWLTTTTVRALFLISKIIAQCDMESKLTLNKVHDVVYDLFGTNTMEENFFGSNVIEAESYAKLLHACIFLGTDEIFRARKHEAYGQSVATILAGFSLSQKLHMSWTFEAQNVTSKDWLYENLFVHWWYEMSPVTMRPELRARFEMCLRDFIRMQYICARQEIVGEERCALAKYSLHTVTEQHGYALHVFLVQQPVTRELAHILRRKGLTVYFRNVMNSCADKMLLEHPPLTICMPTKSDKNDKREHARQMYEDTLMPVAAMNLRNWALEDAELKECEVFPFFVSEVESSPVVNMSNIQPEALPPPTTTSNANFDAYFHEVAFPKKAVSERLTWSEAQIDTDLIFNDSCDNVECGYHLPLEIQLDSL